MKTEEVKAIEIPLDKIRSKQINEKAIELMEKFFDCKYSVKLTESIIDELPILRITKK